MNARPGAGAILTGMFRLARGRTDGFACFGDTARDFMTSLAPLLAFPLVGFVLMLGGGGGLAALADLLATCCALLAPAVLSNALARLWGREAAWLRFATAFNWCQWLIPIAAMLVLTVLVVAQHAGLPNTAAAALALLSLGGYGIWLHFFLARQGLGLSRGRAALLVLTVNLGTVALVMAPRLLSVALR